jgi:signal transduction histidine kinase
MKKIAFFLLMTILSFSLPGQIIKELEKKLKSPTQTEAERIETLNLLSRSFVYVNPVKAMEYANEAFKLATDTKNQFGIANAYRNLSSIHSANESYSMSMDYIERALAIFEMEKDSAGIANCYITLGHTYRRLQNRPEEIKFHLRSYEIFTALKDYERIGVAAHNLGESYFNNRELSKAKQLTLAAIEANDSLDNRAVLSACYKVLGLIELANKNVDVATLHFQNVLKISNELGENSQKVATIESILQLANISESKKDSEAQLRYLLEAAEFSKKYSLPIHLQTAYNKLILYFSIRNSQKKVQQYIIAYQITSDSLNQKQLQDRYSLTNSIIKVHELSKSKNDLEKLNALQLQRIKSRNSLLAVIAISTLFLVLLVVRLARVNRKLNSQNVIIDAQRKDLEILNSTKDKFFSIVAHDLKSPLSSLKSFSSLLINHYDALSKEEILSMSEQLKTSVDNTVKMADNLITWAKMQMNDVQFNKETLEVEQILSNIYLVYKEVAQKKGIKMTCAIGKDLKIEGDRNQIEFIIRNLVNNAIKFTAEGGTINISANKTEHNVIQIAVIDTGVGMSEKIKNDLFLIGRQRSMRGTAGENGTGLGLMLSQEFLKLNDGQIDVESEVGKGTRFNVEFRSVSSL